MHPTADLTTTHGRRPPQYVKNVSKQVSPQQIHLPRLHVHRYLGQVISSTNANLPVHTYRVRPAHSNSRNRGCWQS